MMDDPSLKGYIE